MDPVEAAELARDAALVVAGRRDDLVDVEHRGVGVAGDRLGDAGSFVAWRAGDAATGAEPLGSSGGCDQGTDRNATLRAPPATRTAITCSIWALM